MSTAPFTRRILKTFDSATQAEIKAGIEWYAVAQGQAQTLAKAYGHPMHIVVGVIAALSPNNRWERNLVDAENMLIGWHNGDDVTNIVCCTYKAMRRKAWSILEAMPDVDGVLSILNGQKIIAFAECILGRDACCIDGHALNIARGKREVLSSDKTNVTKKMFRTLQQAYSNAGKRRGFTAYEMQAITWTTWRNAHGIA